MRKKTSSRVIERLESRRLLSSAVLLPGGLLKIAGDDFADDAVTVGLNSSGKQIEVAVNGAVRMFSADRVRTIAFFGGGGNDSLVVLENNGTLSSKVRFHGGDGDDYFRGGGENDWASGGAGNDTLLLGDGENIAYGGVGNDRIFGGSGRDVLLGSYGDDLLDAGQGANFMRGGAGDDTLIDGVRSLSVVETSAARIREPLPTRDATAAPAISIAFDGTNNAGIVNPYSSQGLSVSASGGAVTVTNTVGLYNLVFELTGTTAAGSLTVNSTTPATFVLSDVNITNGGGAAIYVTGGQTHTFISKAGTTNSLTDGSAGTRTGALQTDGRIILSGTGALNLKGVRRHAISTTSVIEVQSSTITVTSAASDGFHSEGFKMTGGSVTIAASASDGIDAGDGAVAISGGTLNVTSTAADVKALKTGNNTITITGGVLNLNVSGNASKAVAAKGTIATTAGTFVINLSGAAIFTASGSGFNPSYCTGFKSDSQIIIDGGNFTITATSTANGGKGFSADADIIINNGTFNISTAGAGGTYVNTLGVADSYSTASFTTDTNLHISGGNFTLTNSGSDGKGFSADGSINVDGGTINVTNSGASGKGFKADANVNFAGGITTINLSGATVLVPTGSGVDPAHPAGVRAWGAINVSGGSVSVTGTATASGARGLSAQGAINVSGGAVNVNVAGNGANYTNSSGVADSYSAAAFSSDTAITVTGGSVTTTSSGTGGKGLKSDGTITIGSATGSPTLNLTTSGARFVTTGTDYNHPKSLLGAGAINIVNGNITISSTDDGIHSDASITISGGTINVNAVSATQGVGEGIEAPIINFTGGLTNVNASNDGINSTYGLVAGGQNTNDNSQLNISGGIIIASGRDAIDANGNITITGGTTIVCGPTAAPEEGIDYNGTFLMNGGLLISAGSNSNMTLGMSAGSAQVSMFLRSSTVLASTSLFHIRNAAGTEMVTFRPKNNVYYFHFSSGALARSTQYSVYFGGSYTGGDFVGNSVGWGLYTGGTYSLVGATLRTTFTTSGTTSVNTVTF